MPNRYGVFILLPNWTGNFVNTGIKKWDKSDADEHAFFNDVHPCKSMSTFWKSLNEG